MMMERIASVLILFYMLASGRCLEHCPCMLGLHIACRAAHYVVLLCRGEQV